MGLDISIFRIPKVGLGADGKIKDDWQHKFLDDNDLETFLRNWDKYEIGYWRNDYRLLDILRRPIKDDDCYFFEVTNMSDVVKYIFTKKEWGQREREVLNRFDWRELWFIVKYLWYSKVKGCKIYADTSW